MAWGYSRLNADAAPARQDLLVVAVKKEVLEEYSEVFSKCGVSPQFTLSALARTNLCHQTSGACALLDIGRKQSELIAFENGSPVSIRILNWGGEHITQAIEQSLGVGREEAVERVLDRAIPKIVSAIPASPVVVPTAARSPSRFDELPDEAFVILRDAATLFGAHRTTLLRMEFRKQLPPRTMRGGRSGWLMGQLRHALRNLPPARQRLQRRPQQIDRRGSLRKPG